MRAWSSVGQDSWFLRGELKGSIRWDGNIPEVRFSAPVRQPPGSLMSIRMPVLTYFFYRVQKAIRLYNVPTRGALFARYSISTLPGQGTRAMPRSCGVSTI